MLVILATLFFVFASQNQQLVWLTPAEFARADHPGLLTQLKYKLINLAGPLMRSYRGHRPNSMVSVNIFTSASPGASPVLGTTLVAGTNDGANAWILSPEELNAFWQRLKTNSSISFLSGMNMVTHDGTGATAATGGRIFSSVTTGIYTNTGTSVAVLPEASAGMVNMLINARSTELPAFAASNSPVAKTNFSTACRAFVPDAGALVLHCHNADPANPTNYWLIISPALVDAAGQRIKK